MKFKGTKGEWEVQTPKHGIGFLYIKTDEKEIAHCCGIKDNGKTTDECKANAQLISCAPEMLEMLEEFITKCDYGMPHDEDLYNKAKQLIKKATEI